MKRFSSVVLLLVVLGFLAHAEAEDRYWIGGSGSWDDPANWSPSGPPSGLSDKAFLTQSDSTDRTVTIGTDDGILVGTITTDALGSGKMTLRVDGGSVSSPFSLTVGYNGTGIVDQSGGSVGSYIGLFLGVNPGSTGIYNLSGGSLYSQFLTVGGAGTAIFNQTGGTVGFTFDGMNVGELGTYNLSGGSSSHNLGMFNMRGTFNLSGTGVLSTSGWSEQIEGTFNQVGGTHDAAMVILGGTYNLSGGTLNAWGATGPNAPSVHIGGTFNLSGGTLDAGHGIHNSGTFNYSGGEMHRGGLTNSDAGVVNLSGTGTRTINGDIVNNGTFKTKNTTAVYNGTFTNNGAYISDPASQHFNDLIIGQNGYLKGGLGDFFFVSGDFKNQSAMNTVWNTSFAFLGFEDGANPLHGFYLAGQDYGAVPTGYKDNFSWGFIDLTGDILQLYDGNNIAGGALYAGDLWGLQVKDSLIKNIIGMDGLKIYYLANQLGNVYLHGLTYNLTGGGRLIPIGSASVPEPATILLFGCGLIGLAGFRRKFKK